MADRIDESIKEFLYRDFSGGLNSLPPGVRIADNQYARGSQDLRRDRGILETRELWTVINNQGSLLTRSPVYGAKVWDGGKGVPILTVAATEKDNPSAVNWISLFPMDINFSSRELSGWGSMGDFRGKTLLPYNFAEYGKYLIPSCPFCDTDTAIKTAPLVPLLLQIRSLRPECVQRMWGLFNLITVWNHRVYIADDQIDGNHLFYSGPRKTIPPDVERTEETVQKADCGFFTFDGAVSIYHSNYNKDRDWFHECNGGGWINFPEETGDVTAFIKGNSYLYVFTEEAIYGVARDNSIRLLASVGTLSQQTVTITPWGIIFLGKDRRLYAWGGTGEPKIIDWPIKDILDEAYIDTPLWIARKKWLRNEDFANGVFTNTKYVKSREGICIEFGGGQTEGSWQSGRFQVLNAIRLLAVHPVYEFPNMDTPADEDEQYMNIGWKTYASAGSPPADWKKVGSFGEMWEGVESKYWGIRGSGEDEDTVGFGYFDHYPRLIGDRLEAWITGPSWDTTDRKLSILYNDAGADYGLPIAHPYSEILIGFKRQDVGDLGPVLKGLSANILCGDPKKVAAAPNLFYYAGKLHLNLAVDSVKDDRPICDTCLVFDGKGWDLHKNHYAAHELEWQGRRVFLGSEWKQSDAADPIGTNRWLWYETPLLNVEKPYLPEGQLRTKAFDFGKPGVIKTIHRIMIRLKQEAVGKVRVYLIREWKGHTVMAQATPDIEINNTGDYKTEVLSVPVDQDGTGVAQGTLFQIGIVGVIGGADDETRAQFRVDAIGFDVSFGEAQETRGMEPIVVGNGGGII